MTAKLTPTAQGSNDVYWCIDNNKPVIVIDNKCKACYAGVIPDSQNHAFLAHVHNGDDIANEMMVLAKVVKGVDDAEAEIEILRDAINSFAQQVHQAYHGAQAPDISNVNHLECPRGFCRSVQHVLNPKRPRGTP